MNSIIQQAKKQVHRKKNFYRHLSVFLPMALFFFALNMLTLKSMRRLWFFYPLLPWGAAILIQYLNTFGFPGNGELSQEWEEEQLKIEVKNILRDHGSENYPKSSISMPNVEISEYGKSRSSDDLNDDF